MWRYGQTSISVGQAVEGLLGNAQPAATKGTAALSWEEVVPGAAHPRYSSLRMTLSPYAPHKTTRLSTTTSARRPPT
ncbi:hypothetical protein E4U36_002422 [Claviceps purpurea]|nr:hypothetical protein E4U11_005873 [Claviceps purpurea]KAG6190550.1 hypothetical protein E4U36_002422 [Claviceps purpurea]